MGACDFVDEVVGGAPPSRRGRGEPRFLGEVFVIGLAVAGCRLERDDVAGGQRRRWWLGGDDRGTRGCVSREAVGVVEGVMHLDVTGDNDLAGGEQHSVAVEGDRVEGG